MSAMKDNGKQGGVRPRRPMPDPELVKKLEGAASECYQSILMPINERMMGPLPQVGHICMGSAGAVS